MRQSNGTTVIYPVQDLFRGRIFQVAVKGLGGEVTYLGPFTSNLEARANITWYNSVFPVSQILDDTSYWVATGADHSRGRGQFEIIADTYLEAVAIAAVSKLGDCPVTSTRFASFPVLGVLES